MGAYNGGIGDPNSAYAEAVRNIANYAPQVITHRAIIARNEAESSQARSDSVLMVLEFGAAAPAIGKTCVQKYGNGCMRTASCDSYTD